MTAKPLRERSTVGPRAQAWIPAALVGLVAAISLAGCSGGGSSSTDTIDLARRTGAAEGSEGSGRSGDADSQSPGPSSESTSSAGPGSSPGVGDTAAPGSGSPGRTNSGLAEREPGTFVSSDDPAGGKVPPTDGSTNTDDRGGAAGLRQVVPTSIASAGPPGNIPPDLTMTEAGGPFPVFLEWVNQYLRGLITARQLADEMLKYERAILEQAPTETDRIEAQEVFKELHKVAAAPDSQRVTSLRPKADKLSREAYSRQ